MLSPPLPLILLPNESLIEILSNYMLYDRYKCSIKISKVQHKKRGGGGGGKSSLNQYQICKVVCYHSRVFLK